MKFKDFKGSKMKKLIILLTGFLLLITWSLAFAKDVNVKGYYRKDGTYVRPHVRSSPDSRRDNNYGPSKRDSELMNPRSRDYDKDGTPNYLDSDDDNDGLLDNNDNSQYGR